MNICFNEMFVLMFAVKENLTRLTNLSKLFILFNPENPPSAKQPVSKMLVIKKVLKEEPIFSTSFSSSGNHLSSSNKNTASPSVYKNLIPKPTAPPTKVEQFTFLFQIFDVMFQKHVEMIGNYEIEQRNSKINRIRNW